jgi:hypothetical protein
MHGSSRRLVLVAMLLAAAPVAASASASQPSQSVAPHGALTAALTSAAESLARFWSWVEGNLRGHRPGPASVATRSPADARGPGVRPDEGSATDPNG